MDSAIDVKQLNELFPNFRDQLTVLPRAPKVFTEFDGLIIENVSHRNSIELLREVGMKGFLLCQNDADYETDDDNTSGGLGCLFIPAHDLTSAFVIKTVKPPFDCEKISRSIASQLLLIQKLLMGFFSPFRLKVQILLIYDSKDKTTLNNVCEKISNMVLGIENEILSIEASQTSLLALNRKCDIKKCFPDMGNRSFSPYIYGLLMHYNREVQFHVKTKKLRSFGGNLMSLVDIRSTVNVFRLFFPGKDHKLLTCPELKELAEESKSKLLDMTDEDGRFVRDYNGYVGEVQNFWCNLVTNIAQPKGVLIKSYSEKNANSFLDKVGFSNRFELDWVFCGSSNLVVFEIGRTNKPDNPSSALKNKLQQVLFKIVPTTLLIVNTLIKQYARSLGEDSIAESANVWHVIRESLRFVLYLPNTTVYDVQEKLVGLLAENKSDGKKITKNGNGTQRLFSSVPEIFFSLILLVVPEDSNDRRSIPSTLTLDKNLRVFKSDTKIEHLLSESTGKVDSDLVEYIAAVLALSCLKDKSEKENGEEKPELLDVILSPQQHKILSGNIRRLRIQAEPGSGKTSLLLAKALSAAKDPKIDYIFFVVPSSKTDLIEELKEFFEKSSSLMKKLDFVLLDSDTPKIIDRFTPKQLHRSIVLIDEIYLTSELKLSSVDGKVFDWCRDLVTHSKLLWSSSIAAGQSMVLSIDQAMPGFKSEPLNLLFRSSQHIGSFSTSFIHENKPISFSSARLSGCFTSSQIEIEVHYFSNTDDPIFADESIVTSVSSQRHKVIVFSNKKGVWENLMAERMIGSRVNVVSPSVDFVSCPFSGSECDAVLIVVDEIPNNDFQQFKCILNLAITRAVFQVTLLIRKKLKHKFTRFLRQPSRYEDVIMDARNQLPVDLRFLQSIKLDGEGKSLLGKLFATAVQHADKALFESLLQNMPPGSSIPSGAILGAMDVEKPKTFMEMIAATCGREIRKYVLLALVAQTFGSKLCSATNKPKVSDMVEVGIYAGLTGLLDTFIDEVGVVGFKMAAKLSGRFLYCACMNGSIRVLKWTIDTITRCGVSHLAATELQTVYKFMAKYDTTLLTLLCYLNYDISESVQLLFDIGFPNDLLLFQFDGRNALFIAIWGDNLELVKTLLSEKRRRDIFLGEKAANKGLSPGEFARQLEFEHIDTYLNSLGAM